MLPHATRCSERKEERVENRAPTLPILQSILARVYPTFAFTRGLRRVYLRTNDSFFCLYEAPCGAKTTYKLYRPFLLFLARFHHFSKLSQLFAPDIPMSEIVDFDPSSILAISPPFSDLTSSLNIGRNRIRRNGGDLSSTLRSIAQGLYRAGESRVLNHVEKERKKKRFRFNCW